MEKPSAVPLTSEPLNARPTAEANALKGQIGQLEAALAEAEDRYTNLEVEAGRLRAILGAVPGWISFIDRERRYRFTNWTLAEDNNELDETATGSLVSEILDDEDYRAMLPDLDHAPCAATRGQNE